MTDKLFAIGSGAVLLRMKDSGDGTVARVVVAGSSSVGTAGDKVVPTGDGTTKKRLRDMGDGTVAEVFFGA